jgi:hypothetical protein
MNRGGRRHVQNTCIAHLLVGRSMLGAIRTVNPGPFLNGKAEDVAGA